MEQTPLIHSFTAELDGRLASFDVEILRVREQLARLEDGRTALLDLRRRTKSILSPIRRIPPEILAEIFKAAGTSRSRFIFANTPWVLTHVCSRWRAIAISAASLWSFIHLDYESHEYHPALVRTQVQRSPTLKIYFYGSEECDAAAQIQPLGYLIVPSAQWQELFISVTPTLGPLLASLCGQIPNLRRIWMQWSDEEAEELGQSIDCFETAESLVDFALTHYVSCRRLLEHPSGGSNRAEGHDADYRTANALLDMLMLDWRHGGIDITPRLAHIHFGFEGALRLDYGRYIEMLTSRYCPSDGCFAFRGWRRIS
ncbi:hypothetical protein FB45DRAFT_1144050 [Roridomyces roridus]|uniref:F-box domain-containing protein n=1 Tax=Roridomyces roridus TaxID=1738132 RepID=A0AAD7AZH2_9AGAR|nr:hypothetical protein FB45DRAFT_1144050 [Roridomyces roridus]